jgi:8-oxo-dGTP pyrophosphatase MutT (NUDIX family)
MVKILEQISSEIRFRNPFWDYRYDKYHLPNGETGEYHYVDSRGSVMIVPKLDDDSFILLKQFRYLNQRESIEFPGGGIKSGKSAEDAAFAELQEESGFKAGKLLQLGAHNPCNGVTNEICTVFLADELEKKETGHDASEEFEMITMTRAEVNQAIRSGEIWDGMTIVAWALYCNQEKLFKN